MTANEFNEQNEVGVSVIYTDDFGNKERLFTRSPAWDVCGTTVVSLEGKSGGYDIERVAVLNPPRTLRELR